MPSVPFDIDNGELDSLSKQQAFVLGFEFSNILSMIEGGRSFAIPVHSDNQDRLVKLCQRLKIAYVIRAHDDWPTLEVEQEQIFGTLGGIQNGGDDEPYNQI